MLLDDDALDNSSSRGVVSMLQHGRTAMIVLAGELDVFDTINLRGVRDRALAPDQPVVLVEGGGVTFVDCAFLGALVTLDAACTRRGGAFYITTASPTLLNLCHLLHLDRLVAPMP